MRGRDIRKYRAEFAEKYLLNVHNGIKDSGVLPVDVNNYTAIKGYLELYYEKIEKRTDRGTTPYNLRNCAYMDDFLKPKLVWKRIGSQLRFSYDEHGFFSLDSTCLATGNHIKYLAAILNTSIGNYLFSESPKTGTGDLIVSVQAFEPAKVFYPNQEQEEHVENLFDILLSETEKSPAFVHTMSELDDYACELYKLSKVEINYIRKMFYSSTQVIPNDDISSDDNP